MAIDAPHARARAADHDGGSLPPLTKSPGACTIEATSHLRRQEHEEKQVTMSEQAAPPGTHIPAPLVAGLFEELHQGASDVIARLEATLPERITAAETALQDWVNDATAAFHGLIARIDLARGTLPQPIATTQAAPAPTDPATPPT